MRTEPRNAEFKALIALKNAMSLKAMGCRFDRGLTGGICVTVAGDAVGCWWFENDRYNFARIAHHAPQLKAETVEEILSQTASFAHAHFMRSQKLAM